MKANFFLKKNIDHHGPNYIPIICHPPDPPTFSLVPTLKHFFGFMIFFQNQEKLRNMRGCSNYSQRDE
jgi:hypothetical protein